MLFLLKISLWQRYIATSPLLKNRQILAWALQRLDRIRHYEDIAPILELFLQEKSGLGLAEISNQKISELLAPSGRSRPGSRKIPVHQDPEPNWRRFSPLKKTRPGIEKRPAVAAGIAQGNRQKTEMKANKIIRFSILLLLLAAPGSAAAKEDFAAANSNYQAGRYAEALKIYLRISRQLTDWQVLYNIGNCYYKLGPALAAKIYYLRARKFRPLEPSIARNIAIVNRNFTMTSSRPTPDFISRAIQVLEAKLSLNALRPAPAGRVLLLKFSCSCC